MQNHYQETLKKAATLSDIYIMREEFQQKANEYEKEYHSGGVKVYSETLKKLTEAKYYVAVADRRILHLESKGIFLDCIDIERHFW